MDLHLDRTLTESYKHMHMEVPFFLCQLLVLLISSGFGLKKKTFCDKGRQVKARGHKTNFIPLCGNENEKKCILSG